jgi:hypothetical protein
VYKNPDLWQRLCNWQRVFITRTLSEGDGFVCKADDVTATSAESSDEELVEGEAQTHTEIEAAEDKHSSEVMPATLRRFVERSRGALLHLDVNPLGWVVAEDVMHILSDSYEGKLLSLRVGGVEIQRDGSSRHAFLSNMSQKGMAHLSATLSILATIRDINYSPEEGARQLARGNPTKGIPPDERFAALLETPPAKNAAAAVAIHQQRMHAKLVSFLREPCVLTP